VTKPREGEKSKKRVLRLIIHPLTAVLLGINLYLIMGRFQLLSFAGAPLISAMVAFTGYWLLSRQYAARLSVVFLAVVAVLTYKIGTLRTLVPPVPKPAEVAAAKLHVLATLVIHHQLRSGELPKTLADIGLDRLTPAGLTYDYCTRPSCPDDLKAWAGEGHAFWIWATTLKGDDKKGPVWYINQSFQTFSVSPTGEWVPWDGPTGINRSP
jgi:hypothetical protein